MDDPLTTGIASAACLIIGALVTKVVDALIRWRQSEDGMKRATRGELYARIVHLESVVQTLQEENSRLNRELGMLQGTLDSLTKRVDNDQNERHSGHG